MLRILLQYLLPLLLPFLVYLAYVALARGYAPGWLNDAPWPHLAVAGVVLMAISLFTWGLMSGAPADHVYVPPRFEDGRVVPSTTVEP
jgi:Family of unknown function (DUF6111)